MLFLHDENRGLAAGQDNNKRRIQETIRETERRGGQRAWEDRGANNAGLAID